MRMTLAAILLAETLVLPPYLDVIVFDVYHGDVVPPVTAKAVIEDETILGDGLSSLTVRRPAAGKWQFVKSRADGRVRIFAQEFYVRGALLAPPPRLRGRVRARVIYRLLDAEKRPLREDAAHPLTVHLKVIDPSGRSSEVRMQRRPELGTGVFRSVHEIDCALEGRYWTEVRASVRTGGRRIDVLHDRASGFDVDH